ncbi:hypothetical protein AZSI13_15320 [Azospira sp. I13]|uniref:hypothetical protein n=1 Tax=Azospira sp. I13 TaxID=1765050 RepID=UPI000D49C159|nr:hypothetical protein [Azospira sp. I13]GBG02205.1 hypothetical protein AZSI13_15320 [Azospira sp. I13]
MRRFRSTLLAALASLALLAQAPLRAEDGGLKAMPLEPGQPNLLELLQRLFVPADGGNGPRTTPRGVVLPNHPAQSATPAAATTVAPATPETPETPAALAAEATPEPQAPATSLPPPAAGEETVAQPLAGPGFEEKSLAQPAPLPPPTAAAPAVPPGTPTLRRERLGYAFGHPRILAQQTLFGLAHGIALLGRSCARVPGSGEAAREAYATWEAANRDYITQAESELARYYFTPPASEVRRLDLVQALNLKSDLGLPTDGPELEAACGSLPQALAKPRYDLATQWLLKGDVERLRRATETRELVSQCRQQADAENLPALDAALAAWEDANSLQASEARERLVADMSSQPDPRHPEQPVDGQAMMEKWQDELRRTVGRRLAYGAAEACPGLAAALAGKHHALEHAFDAEF